jgi:FRG domain-containing protein
MKLELAGNQVRNVQSLAELHEARAAFNGNHREHSAIFRGQRDGWSLSTSLERACLDTDEEVTLARRREAATIREFKRRFHHYAVHVPPLDHALPWLALMQHHGAPTRLLDWTYSIDVAAYFAVEYAWKHPRGDAAVWMMNATWATYRTAEALQNAGRVEDAAYVMTGQKAPKDEAMFGPTFIDAAEALPCVCPVNPFMLNERLTIQKGVFVCVGDVQRPFEENLLAMPGSDRNDYLMKLVVRSENLKGILDELYDVNISRATLFPGLDGFSRSLAINLGSVPHRQDYPALGE